MVKIELSAWGSESETALIEHLKQCGLHAQVIFQRPVNKNHEETTVDSPLMQFSCNTASINANFSSTCDRWCSKTFSQDPRYQPWLTLNDRRCFENYRNLINRGMNLLSLKFGVIDGMSCFVPCGDFEGSNLEANFFHDVKLLNINFNVGISPYKLELRYNCIRKIFICGSSIYLEVAYPPLLYKGEVKRMPKRMRYSLAAKAYNWKRTLNPTGGSVHRLIGMSVVMKMEFYNKRNVTEVLPRLRSRCSNMPLHFVKMHDVATYYPPSNVPIKMESFDCQYAIEAIFKRNFVAPVQLRNSNGALSSLLQKYELSNPKILEKVLFTVLMAIDRGECFIINDALEALFKKYSAEPGQLNADKMLVPDNLKIIRRVTCTPSRVLLWPPEVMKDNRILRNFDPEYSIRVTLRDENQMKFNLGFVDDTILEGSIKKPMNNGFLIGNRHYEFLAWSNSQIRDHGVWMYAQDTQGNTSASIRNWMGDFSSIKSISKYMARMGQCFSATEKSESIEVGSFRMEPDIEYNGYCFSDGIGRMSVDLANKVSKSLKLEKVPSAFQIRFAGFKGMLTMDPYLRDVEIVFRKSMKKFESDANDLEIAKFSAPIPLKLNRPMITILDQLGVNVRIFLNMQELALQEIADILLDEQKAAAFLTMYCQLPNSNFKDLTRTGVMLTEDPFFRSLLLAIHREELAGIREKTRLPIEPSMGRNMFGVLDDTKTLQYGQVFVKYTKNIEGWETNTETVILKGKVLVTKNPCLQPGDIRIFQAVDIPQLHHIVDCIVFPANGHRPHPNEMAGSDLDGDEYAVIWDPKLFFRLPNRPPMDYLSPPDGTTVGPIEVSRMVDFLAYFIANDHIGTIASSHLAHADHDGLNSSVCERLALKASLAVDFAKSGTCQSLDQNDRATKYPDFMNKQSSHETYNSKQALGKLYRVVRDLGSDINFSVSSSVQPKPDPQLICPGWERYRAQAEISWNKYQRLMGSLLYNYGIISEAEALSGSISKIHSRMQERRDRSEIVEIVVKCSRYLWKCFREEFYEELSNDGIENVSPEVDNEGINKEILKKASAWYMVVYTNEKPAFLGFAWIMSKILIHIKADNFFVNRSITSERFPVHSSLHVVLIQSISNNVLGYSETNLLKAKFPLFQQYDFVKLALAGIIQWAEFCKLFKKGINRYQLIDIVIHVATEEFASQRLINSGSIFMAVLKFCLSFRFLSNPEIYKILGFEVDYNRKLGRQAMISYYYIAITHEFNKVGLVEKEVWEEEEIEETNPIRFPQSIVSESMYFMVAEHLKNWTGLNEVLIRKHEFGDALISGWGNPESCREFERILGKKKPSLIVSFATGQRP